MQELIQFREAIKGAHTESNKYIIQQYWNKFFKGKPFPAKGGVSLNQVITAIKYKIGMKWYEDRNEELSNNFYKNYKAAIGFSDNLPKIFKCFDNHKPKLKIKRRYKMVKLKRKKVANKTEEKSAPVENTKKPIKKSAKRTKGLSASRIFALGLILEQKLTDKKIVEKLHKKFPKRKSLAPLIWVARTRLNAGGYIPYGYKAPKGGIVRVK